MVKEAVKKVYSDCCITTAELYLKMLKSITLKSCITTKTSTTPLRPLSVLGRLTTISPFTGLKTQQ